MSMVSSIVTQSGLVSLIMMWMANQILHTIAGEREKIERNEGVKILVSIMLDPYLAETWKESVEYS